jgi:Domain of Unknown Function (DUF1080)
VQIAPANASGDLATGAIVGKRAPDLAAARPVGEWNTYEITMSWNKITVVLNGHTVNTYTVTEPQRINRKSFIGIQHHGPADAVTFRDIRVRSNAVTGMGTFAGVNNKCLDVANGNPADNRVIIYNRAQSWTVPGDGSIRAFHKCLDVRNGEVAAGTPV